MDIFVEGRCSRADIFVEGRCSRADIFVDLSNILSLEIFFIVIILDQSVLAYTIYGQVDYYYKYHYGLKQVNIIPASFTKISVL